MGLSPKRIRRDLDKGRAELCGLITWGPLQLEVFKELFTTDVETRLKLLEEWEAKKRLPIERGNTVVWAPKCPEQQKKVCHSADLVLPRSPGDHLTSTYPSGRGTTSGVQVVQTTSCTVHTAMLQFRAAFVEDEETKVLLLYPLKTSNPSSPFHISSHLSTPMSQRSLICYPTDPSVVQL